MINLLPPETRNDMLYARRNTRLLKWSSILLFALLGVGIIIASGLIYLTETTKTIEKQNISAQAILKNQDLDETQKKVEEISGNVKLASDVLSREVLFSKVLRQLGAALPAQTSLQELEIDDLKGGLTLKAVASDIPSATQIQVNLQDPNNQLFDKADIESINCDASTQGNSSYPCTVQIRALFAKNNPYSYLHTPRSGGEKQ